MCLSLFLYSDRALPLVAWDPASPTFNVTDLEPFEEAARGMVDVPFVYACWSGDAHRELAVVRTMTIEELTQREEWLEEGALTRLGITVAE